MDGLTSIAPGRALGILGLMLGVSACSGTATVQDRDAGSGDDAADAGRRDAHHIFPLDGGSGPDARFDGGDADPQPHLSTVVDLEIPYDSMNFLLPDIAVDETDTLHVVFLDAMNYIHYRRYDLAAWDRLTAPSWDPTIPDAFPGFHADTRQFHRPVVLGRGGLPAVVFGDRWGGGLADQELGPVFMTWYDGTGWLPDRQVVYRGVLGAGGLHSTWGYDAVLTPDNRFVIAGQERVDGDVRNVFLLDGDPLAGFPPPEICLEQVENAGNPSLALGPDGDTHLFVSHLEQGSWRLTYIAPTGPESVPPGSMTPGMTHDLTIDPGGGPHVALCDHCCDLEARLHLLSRPGAAWLSETPVDGLGQSFRAYAAEIAANRKGLVLLFKRELATEPDPSGQVFGPGEIWFYYESADGSVTHSQKICDSPHADDWEHRIALASTDDRFYLVAECEANRGLVLVEIR